MVERIERLGRVLPGAALVLDATGVGRAVFDHQAKEGHVPVGVVITAGRKTRFGGRAMACAEAGVGAGAGHVPREWAVEGGERASGRGDFVRELQYFKVTIGKRGHAGFAGKGAHDDLAIATALAVWWAPGLPRSGTPANPRQARPWRFHSRPRMDSMMSRTVSPMGFFRLDGSHDEAANESWSSG